MVMVELSGEVDIATKDELRARLDAAAEQSDSVDIDLSKVEYADSTALGLLIGLRNRLRERGGGDVRLIAPSLRMRKLLNYAGLDQAFTIVE
ncbi:MAG TPA: STAS domain-containing protein [Candidatus Baltobacteraceae bacterium]|nr:STAS domain-containing protein [Candidatus Baltobacteraceae bacterium]